MTEEEIMKLERKAMDECPTYKCPDCDYDLSAHDAYQVSLFLHLSFSFLHYFYYLYFFKI